MNLTITGGGLPSAGTKVTADAQGEACLDGLGFGCYDGRLGFHLHER